MPPAYLAKNRKPCLLLGRAVRKGFQKYKAQDQGVHLHFFILPPGLSSNRKRRQETSSVPNRIFPTLCDERCCGGLLDFFFSCDAALSGQSKERVMPYSHYPDVSKLGRHHIAY